MARDENRGTPRESLSAGDHSAARERARRFRVRPCLRYHVLDGGAQFGEDMSVPEIVHRLADRFETDRKTFRSPAYKEDWIRRDFIDPLFEALGWDVANRRGVPVGPQREVVPEERLKGSSVKGSRSTTAPDYAFRL